MNTPSKPKQIKINLPLFSMLAIMAIILSACATSTTPAQTPAAPQQASSAAAEANVPTINIATDPALGKILVDGRGMTLYIFTKDEADKSNCDAGCLANWPPLVTSGAPKLGAGVDPSLVGTAILASGDEIVTYNHRPLYYWVGDSSAGQTSGEGVNGVWFVISPDGQPVESPIASAPTTAPADAFTEPTINVASDPTLGQYLVDGNGMTLYIFKNDGRDQSNCDAGCLANWPPVLTQGNPIAGPGVDASQFGTATLSDGSLMVTYDHRPLYYWVKDTKPGDTTGQGVGDVWFVISPSGQEIDDSAQPVADPTPDPEPSAVEPTIMVATDSTLGQYLVDGKGMTLYIYTRDTADQSNCSGDCLASWPPLLTQGNPVLGPGTDDSKIGSALLADGTRIVTYNHMPLYYWIKDGKPGDITGQGVGGVWYVIDPDGDIIGK